MKTIKIIFLSLSFFIIAGAISVYASSGSGSVSVGVSGSVSVSGGPGSYTVSTSAGTGGTISPTSKVVSDGSVTTFDIYSKPGYYLTSASGCGGFLTEASGYDIYVTEPITSNCTVTATFSQYTYTVSTNGGSGVTFSPSSELVTHGFTTTFDIYSNPGYYLTSASGCGGTLEEESNYDIYNTGPITSNCTVTATFAKYTCSNGADNPPACTMIEDSCLNGATNPPTCTTFNTTGTLNGSNCEIAKDQSTCNTTLILNVINPVGGAETNITKPVDNQVAYGLTPASKPNISVDYPSTTFYLNHNGFTLDNKTITASCVEGTKWDTTSQTCKTNAEMSGQLTADDCQIKLGDNSCSSSLNWETINPIGVSAVTTPTDITVATGNEGSGSYTFSNGPSSRNFYLYNNGELLAQDSAAASCVDGAKWDTDTNSCIENLNPIDGGWGDSSCLHLQCEESCTQECTRLCDSPAPQNGGANCSGDTSGSGVWNYTQSCTGGLCAAEPGGPGSGVLNINFSANPSSIFKGRSITLTWTSDADSCIGDSNFSTGEGNKANGSTIVTPTKNTTYTITCRGIVEETNQVEVKIIPIFIKEL